MLSSTIALGALELGEHELQRPVYQERAIRAIEGAIAAGRKDILVAMATGTGKTKTCIALV